MARAQEMSARIEVRLAEAERAVRRGWVLTPLRGKKPILAHWTARSVPSVDEVREWARSGNLGLRTGAISGVFVIDIDPTNGGDASRLDLPTTVTVRTGGGGLHFYFAAFAESLGNSASRLGPGIDTRGDRGQIVFVGSVHPDTHRTYRWATGLSPDQVPLAPLPDRIADLLRAPSRAARNGATIVPPRAEGYAAAALRSEVESVRSAVEGTRNNVLNIAAFNLGQLISAGLLTEEEVFQPLFQAALDAGLTQGESMSTIRSGITAGRQQPRPTTPLPSTSRKLTPVVPFKNEQRTSKPPDSGSGDGKDDSLPVIDAGEGNLPRLAKAAWSAVKRANDPPRWFRYGDLPTRLQRDDKHILIVRELNQDRMKYLLARVATWMRLVGVQVKEVHPPSSVVHDMLACPEPPLPILTRIVEAPIFAPDGTLCVDPGYNAASQTFYAPAKGFVVPPVSNEPTADEIARARSLLLDDLLVDFPFIGDAERANAIALALLPFVRDLIDGATPLHLFEKPSPGTGGTLLVEVLLYPALGHAVATLTEGRDEEEWRKRLTAKLMQGPSAILIDNLRNPLEASAVAAAITATTWEDRILGVSQIARIPVRCAWAATGNNPMVSNEMARRAIRVRLDAKMDQPWRREDFKHPKLIDWTREHRADLVWSLLTMGQAWLASGRPEPLKPMSVGMFEDWSRVVGGILSHAGIEGFLGNLDQFYIDTDMESSSLRGFVVLWFEKFGDQAVGVSDLLPLVLDNDLFDLGEGSDRSQRTRLGKLISKQRDRQFGDIRVVGDGEAGGSQLWHLEQVTKAPDKK